MPIASETLSLFWELLQCNKRFRSYLIDTGRSVDFVILVLYFAVDGKNDPAKQNVLRMCVFILQTLSIEERFGQKLNQSFLMSETLPQSLQIPKFHGSYADFLISVGGVLCLSVEGSLFGGLTIGAAHSRVADERQHCARVFVSGAARYHQQHRAGGAEPAAGDELKVAGCVLALLYACLFAGQRIQSYLALSRVGRHQCNPWTSILRCVNRECVVLH